LDNHPRKTVKDKMIQLSENAATGVRKGIADFVLIDLNGNSIWIELKLPNETQSKEQKEFEQIVNKYYIAYTVDQFINICKTHINENN
jgi:hypothetical protein